MRARPYWMMAGRLFQAEECAALVALAHAKGWKDGTYSDGSKRGNVSVRFLSAEDGQVAADWLEAFRRVSPLYGSAFGIEIQPDTLEVMQVSRWQKGDNYGMHFDHDIRGILPLDRKLSLYVSLSPGGGLEIDKLGHVRCETGDALAFPAIVPHAAPVQGEGERYSVVAWVSGPDWR